MEAHLIRIDLIKITNHTDENIYISDSGELELLEVNEYSEIKYSRIDFSKDYFIIQGEEKVPLIFSDCVRDPRFDEMFFYDGFLGFEYTNSKTSFRVWSPIATKAILLLDDDEIEMTRSEGVWEVSVERDCDKLPYKYKVWIHHKWVESIDPYAISSSANGSSSFVIDLQKANVDLFLNSLNPVDSYTDAVIYEMHIRDFTYEDASVTNKGKFIGLLESEIGGLEYLESLGVTHIQLMPINDFQTVDETDQFAKYNWGYDPSQYNVPEGSYSIDPSDPYSRIIELKTLIAEFHKRGLRVNMDVVYNHVYDVLTHPFNLTMPGYYFRYNNEGTLSNGTGCSNDTESRRRMVSKYIIDSILYWNKEYGIDGFRIDLMGIHHIDLINDIRTNRNKIDKSLRKYSEGWNLNTALHDNEKAIIPNHLELGNVGFFNDKFRNFLKGELFIDKSLGLISDNKQSYRLGYFLCGSIIDFEDEAYFKEPYHSINYVECHDDFTLFDKLIDVNEENIKEKQRLVIALILISQGIPFLHSGIEFLRTKFGEHNSYDKSDEINKINWDLVLEHNDLIEYTKQLIKLRKLYPHFRLASKEDIRDCVKINVLSLGVVEYKIKLKEELIVIINSNSNSYEYDTSDCEVIFGSFEGNNITIMKKVG